MSQITWIVTQAGQIQCSCWLSSCQTLLQPDQDVLQSAQAMVLTVIRSLSPWILIMTYYGPWSGMTGLLWGEILDFYK